jgi:hypothetical protein
MFRLGLVLVGDLLLVWFRTSAGQSHQARQRPTITYQIINYPTIVALQSLECRITPAHQPIALGSTSAALR